MDDGKIRSSAYLVSQASFVTQKKLDGIDREEEEVPVGNVLGFQVSSAYTKGAQKKQASPHACKAHQGLLEANAATLKSDGALSQNL